METKLIKTASGMEVVTAREYAEKLIDCVVKSNFPLHNKETILNIGVALIDEYASQFKPTLLTEDKEGEGQGDLWDELFDHIENTPVDVPWADCIKELKQKFKITKK